jgi:uncharacterized membrane protein
MTYDGPDTQAAALLDDDLDVDATQYSSRASIMGHPIHPMLVPLPVASVVGAFLSDLQYARTGDRFWARASRILLGSALVTGAVAAPFGVADFALVPHARKPIDGWIHGIGNGAVMALTAVNLLPRLADAEKGAKSGLLMSATAAMAVGLTGWLGGELSYRHRIGMTAEHDDA